MDFRLTLYEPPSAPFAGHRVLGWFTFEAPDIEAAMSFAKEHYGPAIDATECATLRPSADDGTPEVFLKGRSGARLRPPQS